MISLKYITNSFVKTFSHRMEIHMKQSVILYLFFLTSICFAGLNFQTLSESSSLIRYTVSMGSHTSTSFDTLGCTYTHISFDDAQSICVEGYPMFPYSSKHFISSPNSTVTLTINSILWTAVDTLNLAPAEYVFEDEVATLPSGTPPYWEPGFDLSEPVDCGSYQLSTLYIQPFKVENGILYKMSSSDISLEFDDMSRFTVPSELRLVGDQTFMNYTLLDNYISYTDGITADYLVIYSHDPLSEEEPPGNVTEYKDALTPLMNYRDQLGYTIRWQYLTPLECTPAAVQSVIDTYLTNPNFNVKYIILLGDLIPPTQLNDPDPDRPGNVIFTDNWYLNDYHNRLPGLGIGRFPGDPDDIETLVAKTLAYENYYDLSDLGSLDCNEVVLLAHESDWPLPQPKYAGNCEDVANSVGFNYTCDLDFIKYYRDDGPIGASSIKSTVQNEVGVVSYRGHASWNSYPWNVPGYQTRADISSQINTMYPVVFNVACESGSWSWPNLTMAWLQDANGGAVSVYSADDPTDYWCNNALHKNLFKYNFGLTYPSVSPNVARMALWANVMMIYDMYGSAKAWSTFYNYIWHGDPGLRLWTEESAPGRLGFSPVLSSIDQHDQSHYQESVLLASRPFPNPASCSVTFPVTLHNASELCISILDLSGRIVDVKEYGDFGMGMHSLVVDVSKVPQGIYTALVSSSNGLVESHRIVVTR